MYEEVFSYTDNIEELFGEEGRVQFIMSQCCATILILILKFLSFNEN